MLVECEINFKTRDNVTLSNTKNHKKINKSEMPVKNKECLFCKYSNHLFIFWPFSIEKFVNR